MQSWSMNQSQVVPHTMLCFFSFIFHSLSFMFTSLPFLFCSYLRITLDVDVNVMWCDSSLIYQRYTGFYLQIIWMWSPHHRHLSCHLIVFLVQAVSCWIPSDQWLFVLSSSIAYLVLPCSLLSFWPCPKFIPIPFILPTSCVWSWAQCVVAYCLGISLPHRFRLS